MQRFYRRLQLHQVWQCRNEAPSLLSHVKVDKSAWRSWSYPRAAQPCWSLGPSSISSRSFPQLPPRVPQGCTAWRTRKQKDQEGTQVRVLTKAGNGWESTARVGFWKGAAGREEWCGRSPAAPGWTVGPLVMVCKPTCGRGGWKKSLARAQDLPVVWTCSYSAGGLTWAGRGLDVCGAWDAVLSCGCGGGRLQICVEK